MSMSVNLFLSCSAFSPPLMMMVMMMMMMMIMRIMMMMMVMMTMMMIMMLLMIMVSTDCNEGCYKMYTPYEPAKNAQAQNKFKAEQRLENKNLPLIGARFKLLVRIT
jgi:membrane protein required for beta-lactamase induction